MAPSKTRLAETLAEVIDGLGRYRDELQTIRADLDQLGDVAVDPRAVTGVTTHVRDLLEALQPLEMQLGAVARQEDTLRTFSGLGVDFDAFARVDRTAAEMTELLDPLRRKLGEFEQAQAGFRGVEDVDAQLALVDGAMTALSAFGEADAALQAEIEALEEPLRAHREAVLALQARTREVIDARRRHGAAFGALRETLRALAEASRSRPEGEADLAGLTEHVERFEQARRAQLAALDALGFDGLVDRLTEFEDARADEIPDFRNRRLDGLKAGVGRFDEIHARHRAALEEVELGELERNLGHLQKARGRQLAELSRLGVDVVLDQLLAVEQARARQHNALSTLSLGELERRFMETIERLALLGAQIARVDLRDRATAPPADEDEAF